MRRTHQKRLQQVEATISALPIPVEEIRNAFLHFRASGQLPEDQRRAAAVVRHCRRGWGDDGWIEHDFGVVVRRYLNTPPRPDDPVMDALYDEAVWGESMVRSAARHVLVTLSDLGADVTEAAFAKFGSKVDLPEWGSVGLRLLGIPECLAVPPYEKQAERLFARYAVLRGRVDQDDRGWFEELAVAVGMFQEKGVLMGDELLRECVLADGEFRCLLAHCAGEGDVEALAAFDAVAPATGAEWDEAVAGLRQLRGFSGPNVRFPDQDE